MKRGTDCPGTPIIKRPTIHAKEALYTQKRPTIHSRCKRDLLQKPKEACSTSKSAKEPYSRRKRALLQTQKSPSEYPANIHREQRQKRPTIHAKEAYYTCKRGLLYMQKRPTIHAKEAQCTQKRPTIHAPPNIA